MNFNPTTPNFLPIYAGGDIGGGEFQYRKFQRKAVQEIRD
jgi:hypothetical protein